MTEKQTGQANSSSADSSQSGQDEEPKARGMEPLTSQELDEFLQRARERGAGLTQEEARARTVPADSELEDVALNQGEGEADSSAVARLSGQFFSGEPAQVRPRKLVQGLVFDFDNTLARLNKPLDELMKTGAQTAVQYMRSTGMTDLPDEISEHLVEARIFAETKSDDEQEEHTADDTLSFLLQFVGYPASRMNEEVLRRAVDLFYAPEMTAWEPMPGAIELLRQLHGAGFPLAVIANYASDRIFQRIIDYTGLRTYLDVCLSSAAVEWRKPEKEIYSAVLDRWDAEPYELICVGDSLKHDVAGGQEIGALTVHCRMIPLAEDQRLVDSIKPDAVIQELSELPALIETWC